MAEIVSKRYARALFDICVEENTVDKVAEDAAQIVNLYNEDDFKIMIEHPNLSSEEKFTIIKNAFGEHLADTLYGFFHVVFTKNRENHIFDILTAFLSFVDDYKGLTVATVTTPFELSSEKIEQIKSKLSVKLSKKVDVNVVVDKSLIGGIIINVDGMLIDSSIQSSIKNLNKQLLNV